MSIIISWVDYSLLIPVGFSMEPTIADKDRELKLAVVIATEWDFIKQHYHIDNSLLHRANFELCLVPSWENKLIYLLCV